MDATSLPLIRLALRTIHLLPQGEKVPEGRMRGLSQKARNN
jgi:hypothetical protein